MKSIKTTLLALLVLSMMLIASTNTAEGRQEQEQEHAIVKRPSDDSIQAWKHARYGLFIHFSLFSAAGGVWKGQPIRSGYSEQIRAFAKLSKEEYATTLAPSFKPDLFNADEIVSLAIQGGMRSVVITAKHHDGYCIFQTATTRFNIVDGSSPGFKRDLVGELSKACAKRQIGFGIYFSLIDWDHPDATPPDFWGANDNEIPPAHEALNIRQITELLDGRYGNISEVWFDMGKPTPEHSRQLAELVHRLQPHCMINGRVWNHQGDFVSLSDNQIPDSALDHPWQAPLSIFEETWGYRSWQQRGDLDAKIAELILKFVKIIDRGGNLLLNIGPKGDGSIVDYEADVIKGIGKWVHAHELAIFGTNPNPFGKLDYGYAASSPGKLFLFLLQWPPSGFLNLPGLQNSIRKVSVLGDFPAGKRSKIEQIFKVENGILKFTLDGLEKPHLLMNPFLVLMLEISGDHPIVLPPPQFHGHSKQPILFPLSEGRQQFRYNGRGYYDPPELYKISFDFVLPVGIYRLLVVSGSEERFEELDIQIDRKKQVPGSLVFIKNRPLHSLTLTGSLRKFPLANSVLTIQNAV